MRWLEGRLSRRREEVPGYMQGCNTCGDLTKNCLQAVGRRDLTLGWHDGSNRADADNKLMQTIAGDFGVARVHWMSSRALALLARLR